MNTQNNKTYTAQWDSSSQSVTPKKTNGSEKGFPTNYETYSQKSNTNSYDNNRPDASDTKEKGINQTVWPNYSNKHPNHNELKPNLVIEQRNTLADQNINPSRKLAAKLQDTKSLDRKAGYESKGQKSEWLGDTSNDIEGVPSNDIEGGPRSMMQHYGYFEGSQWSNTQNSRTFGEKEVYGQTISKETPTKMIQKETSKSINMFESGNNSQQIYLTKGSTDTIDMKSKFEEKGSGKDQTWIAITTFEEGNFFSSIKFVSIEDGEHQYELKLQSDFAKALRTTAKNFADNQDKPPLFVIPTARRNFSYPGQQTLTMVVCATEDRESAQDQIFREKTQGSLFALELPSRKALGCAYAKEWCRLFMLALCHHYRGEKEIHNFLREIVLCDDDGEKILEKKIVLCDKDKNILQTEDLSYTLEKAAVKLRGFLAGKNAGAISTSPERNIKKYLNDHYQKNQNDCVPSVTLQQFILIRTEYLRVARFLPLHLALLEESTWEKINKKAALPVEELPGNERRPPIAGRETSRRNETPLEESSMWKRIFKVGEDYTFSVDLEIARCKGIKCQFIYFIEKRNQESNSQVGGLGEGEKWSSSKKFEEAMERLKDL